MRLLPLNEPVDQSFRHRQVASLFLSGDYRDAFKAALAPTRGGTQNIAVAMDTMATAAAHGEQDPDLYARAEQASSRAFAIAPHHVPLRWARGWLLIEIGRIEEGMELVEPMLDDESLAASDSRPTSR